MRTYTYVEKHGNNIYHRWVEDGEHYSEVTSEFEIPLYLRHPNGTALSLYKEPLIEKTFDSIPEANAFIDRYDGVEGMDVYGQTDFSQAFIAKYYPQPVEFNIKDFIIASVDLEVEHGDMSSYLPSTPVRVKDGTVMTLESAIALGDDYEIWDVEAKGWRKYKDSCYAPTVEGFPDPDKAEGRIMSISMKVFKGESLAFGLLPKPDAPELENVTYFQCHSEKDMLSKFLLEFRRISPHIFTGWNCVPLTNSLWYREHIGVMSDTMKGDVLYDSSVNTVFPVTEKNVFLATLENGKTFVSSGDHIYPIHYLPKTRYFSGADSLIYREARAEEVAGMLGENNVYVKVPLNVNENRDITYRELIMRHYDHILKKGFRFVVDGDAALTRKVSAVTGRKSWDVRDMDFWSNVSVEGMLGRQEVMRHLDSVSEIRAFRACGGVGKGAKTLRVRLDDVISQDDLWLAGMWITDGTHTYGTECSICNNNVAVASRVRRVLNANTARGIVLPKPSRVDGCYYNKFGISQWWFLKMFIYDGLVVGSNKSPDVRLLSSLSRDQFGAFLAGVIDGDGHIRDGRIAICCAIPENRQKYAELLAWNGIFSNISSSNCNFRLDDRYDTLRNNLTHDGKAMCQDHANSARGSKSNAKKFFYGDGCAFVRVKDISDTGDAVPMIDISTDTHMFVSNGVVTHNCYGFDIPYLVNRLNNVFGENYANNLSPFYGKARNCIRACHNNEGQNSYRILGFTVLDYQELYKKFNPDKQESYKLDYIGEVEGVGRKIDYSEYGNSLMRLYRGEWNIPATADPETLQEKDRWARMRGIIRDKLKARGINAKDLKS